MAASMKENKEDSFTNLAVSCACPLLLPIFMADNARPHKARIVRAFLQQEALDV
jgi:hypothetical protein